MNNLTPEQLKKLKRAQLVKDKGMIGILELLDELERRIENDLPAVTDIISRLKGDKGDSPTSDELLDLITPLIPQVEHGHTPTRDELLELIRPLIPQVKDGQKPTNKELIELIEPLIPKLPDVSDIASTASKLAQDEIKPLIPTIEQIEQNIPKLGEPIRDSLELLDGDERLDISAIKGFEKLLEEHKANHSPRVIAAGSRLFTLLKDTPSDYRGQAGKTLVVNDNETGLEFADGVGGAVTSVNGQVGDVSLGIDDLNDVVLDDIQSGQTLVWNGSEWVNQDASGFSGTEASVPFVGTDGLLTEDNAHFKYLENEVQLQVGQDSPLWSGSTQDPIIAVGEIDDYLGVTVQNLSSGTGASTDLVASADNDDGSLLDGKYVNVGITSSTFNAGDVLYPPNTSYLAAFGGNLNILAYTAGKQVNIITGGDTIDNLRATFQDDKTTFLANYDADICPAFTGGNWTGTNGWSVSGGELVKVSDAAIGTIEPSTPLTIAINTTYKVTITASATSGAITYTLGSVSGSPIVSGTTVNFITAISTANLIISGAISSTATITAITIEPLIDNTGDVFIEGNLTIGSTLNTISGEPVMNIDGDGVVTFPNQLPLGPAGVTPTQDDELTPKFYVDGLLTSGRFIGSVNAATTTALAACTYANGSSGVGATLTGNANGAFATIDGVAAALNNTYLIKNQASGLQNGAYKLTQVGDGGTPFILTRLTTYDTSSEIATGTFFLVIAGTVNGSQQWGLITTGTVTVGTTALTYEQLSSSPVYTGGDGIDVTGTVIDVALASTPALEFDSGGLRVFADDSSIERSASGLRVKAGGITNAMLAGGIEAPSSGAINGSNRVYVFAHTPLFVTLNGLIYYENDGYTLSGLTLTFIPEITPATGSIIRSHY